MRAKASSLSKSLIGDDPAKRFTSLARCAWSAKGERLIQLGEAGAGVAVATQVADRWRTKAIVLDSSQRKEAACR